MKKIVSIITILLLSLGLLACIKTPVEDDPKIDIKEGQVAISMYGVNDLHGAIFEENGEPGIAKISTYLKEKRAENEEGTLIFSAGDMFQGTAVSSLTKGRVVVDAMNEIGFDAMGIGNHEFDWGISDIEKFLDGDAETNKMNFPLLGANIIEKATGEAVPFTKPYTVIEKAGLKIGVVGAIGDYQETSILTSIIAPYEFTDTYAALVRNIKILRESEHCDIVVALVHDDTSAINEKLALLKGNERIDAIFNGHTHRYYAYETSRDNDVALPVVQSGSNGNYVGVINLVYDYDLKKVVTVSAENVNVARRSLKDDKAILNIFKDYQSYIDIANEKLGKAGMQIDKGDFTQWAVKALQEENNADAAFINSGGIRSGFPLYSGSEVTYGSIFKMMPFDNKIVITYLTGSEIKAQLSNLVSHVKDGLELDDNKVYKVATIDYVYEKPSYRLQGGTNTILSDILFRDKLVDAVRHNIEKNGSWKI
ncbi:MAG TPA: bifunctional metallophosphatase/5'-nucleotidase [Acholeplasmataceae bacterium]|nr:bifunctional metallophosphatase/5'-nucleotidase [Acholeplasmataceae bacterium]